MQISDSTWLIYPPEPLFDGIRGILLNALAFTGGDQARAAALLGISARSMSYSMARYDIPSGAIKTRAYVRERRWKKGQGR